MIIKKKKQVGNIPVSKIDAKLGKIPVSKVDAGLGKIPLSKIDAGLGKVATNSKWDGAKNFETADEVETPAKPKLAPFNSGVATLRDAKKGVKAAQTEKKPEAPKPKLEGEVTFGPAEYKYVERIKKRAK